MSAHCKTNDCFHKCCDITGNCPSLAQHCYYYYDNSINPGVYIGIAIGAFILVALIVAAICYCCRKRR